MNKKKQEKSFAALFMVFVVTMGFIMLDIYSYKEEYEQMANYREFEEYSALSFPTHHSEHPNHIDHNSITNLGIYARVSGGTLSVYPFKRDSSNNNALNFDSPDTFSVNADAAVWMITTSRRVAVNEDDSGNARLRIYEYTDSGAFTKSAYKTATIGDDAYGINSAEDVVGLFFVNSNWYIITSRNVGGSYYEVKIYNANSFNGSSGDLLDTINVENQFYPFLFRNPGPSEDELYAVAQLNTESDVKLLHFTALGGWSNELTIDSAISNEGVSAGPIAGDTDGTIVCMLSTSSNSYLYRISANLDEVAKYEINNSLSFIAPCFVDHKLKYFGLFESLSVPYNCSIYRVTRAGEHYHLQDLDSDTAVYYGVAECFDAYEDTGGTDIQYVLEDQKTDDEIYGLLITQKIFGYNIAKYKTDDSLTKGKWLQWEE